VLASYWLAGAESLMLEEAMTSINSDSLEATGSPLRKLISSVSLKPEWYEKRERVAALLEEQLSSVPLHRERAQRIGKEYWLDLSESYWNLSD
jgi:hypothetical protein